MTETAATRHREAQRAYVRTDKGQARLQRVNEERQQGYQLLRAQGVSRDEAKRRARQALRELLKAELERQAQEGGDS